MCRDAGPAALFSGGMQVPEYDPGGGGAVCVPAVGIQRGARTGAGVRRVPVPAAQPGHGPDGGGGAVFNPGGGTALPRGPGEPGDGGPGPAVPAAPAGGAPHDRGHLSAPDFGRPGQVPSGYAHAHGGGGPAGTAEAAGGGDAGSGLPAPSGALPRGAAVYSGGPAGDGVLRAPAAPAGNPGERDHPGTGPGAAGALQGELFPDREPSCALRPGGAGAQCAALYGSAVHGAAAGQRQRRRGLSLQRLGGHPGRRGLRAPGAPHARGGEPGVGERGGPDGGHGPVCGVCAEPGAGGALPLER